MSISKKITRKAAPIQDVNHPPIAKKTYTEKAASLVPNSAARWRAIGNILANNNQRSNKEEKYTRENTTRVRPKKKKPQHKSTKIRSKVLEVNANLIKQHKHDTSPSLRCSRKNRMTGKNFMKLIIPV